jgi:hypothetical protein
MTLAFLTLNAVFDFSTSRSKFQKTKTVPVPVKFEIFFELIEQYESVLTAKNLNII